MKKYPIVPLGEVCDFVYGDSLKETDRKGGDVPVYGSNGIVGWHDEAITKGETIIVGRKGSIGEIHLSKIPCWAIDTTYYIDKTKAPCDFTWLYYTLKALDLTRLNKSAAVPGLNRDDAYEQKIPLPPLTEQKRIASLLERADRLRSLRRTARDLGESLLQSVFLEMFGEPIRNPMKWDKVEISEITESLDSRRIPVESSIRQTRKGQYPYYGASGIIDYVDEFIFDEETLLVAEDGANLLARSTPIAFIATGKYWVNNHAHVLKMKSVNIQFLRYLLNGIDLEPYVTGSAQPKLNASNLEKIRVINPPLSQQEEFAGVVARVEGLRERMSESERQAEGLFESLLALSFGEGLSEAFEQ